MHIFKRVAFTLVCPLSVIFFGSRHGKKPSDGEAAVIKSAATRAVKCRRVLIQTPLDFFNFGQDTLSLDGECVHYKRKFIYIDCAAIEVERNAQPKELKTLKMW